MINFYTENLFFSGKVKNLIKIFSGWQNRGPRAVQQSLFLGLKELGQDFSVNRQIFSPVKFAGILADAKILKWAIGQKQKGLIDKIIAGPNLVVGPEDSEGIVKNPLVDIFLVPCPWVKDFYISTAPEMEKKIRVWPAGVAVPELQSNNKIYDFLIYNKIKNNPLCREIQTFLQAGNFKYKVLNYGQFKQQDYFDLLEKTKFEIYLSDSESQGLAMFEAWARNIPVLAWERGLWQTDKYSWQGFTASPYTESENGNRFKDFEEFKKVLPLFVSATYHPREFVLKNFSNRICAQKYLDIVKQLGVSYN